MSFNAYLALGSIDGKTKTFIEADGGDYARQMVNVLPRDAQDRSTFGGRMGPATIINAAHPSGRSSIVFSSAVEAGAQALFADAKGGEPLAWWPAEADAPEPYTREAGEIRTEPQGAGFELVLDRSSGAPLARVAQAT